MKRHVLGLTFSLLAAVTVLPALAAEPPFAGRWSGGPATCREPFQFTPSRYTPPGGKTLRIAKIERDGSNYLLLFNDGYRVALFDVGKATLTWHSPISGDTFELERCR